MAFGTLIKDAEGTPVAQVYIPGTGFVALKGVGSSVTDGSGNASTGLAVGNDFSEQASLTAGALNALLVPVTDVSNYSWFTLQIVGNAHVGQLSWEGSNDNFASGPVGLYAYQQGVPSAYFLNATNVGNGVQIFHGPVVARYFRVRMNGYTSGSVTGTLELHALPSFAGSINAIQAGNWYLAGPSRAPVAQSANTAGAVVVKGSQGWLHSATVTTLGTAALSIYDNAAAASGTILLTIPASAAVGSLYTFPGGAYAANGIVSGGVTNCPAVTFQSS